MAFFKLQNNIFEVIDLLCNLLVIVLVQILRNGRKQTILDLQVLFAHFIQVDEQIKHFFMVQDVRLLRRLISDQIAQIFINQQSYFLKKISMKTKSLFFCLLLTSLAFSFTIFESYPQLQETNQILVQVGTEASKSLEDLEISDDYHSQLKQADTIYYNGTILTMAENQHVQAIAIKDGIIVQAGSTAQVLIKCRWNVNTIKMINLQGKTMMPGFYDAHSHIAGHSINKIMVNLASPPLGNITSIPQVQSIIKSYIIDKHIPAGQVVQCAFYNDLGLIERRLLTRLQLDQVSTEHLIIVTHISGHLAMANTKAIQEAGINQTTPDPQGGRIQRFQEGQFKGTPSGVFKERAKTIYLDPFSSSLGNNSQSQAIIQAGIQDYIEAGVTTAQQGWIGQGSVQLLLQMKDKISIDIRGYYPCAGQYSSTFEKYAPLQTSRFRLQGIKIVVDGSIQGYTGYLTQPYFTQPDYNSIPKFNLYGQNDEQVEYRGFSSYSQLQISTIVAKAFQNVVDIITHCNGDAAVDMFLQAVKNARAIYPSSNPRVTIIHAQTIREDQLDEAKRLRLIPSFFVGHTYYWGDQHRDKFLGPQRARRISPTRSAAARGINFTLHNDAPVTPIINTDKSGIFMIVWSAVNRLTLTEKVLGEQQKISVLQALKSVTIRSAYQSHEQHIKGSIEKGKIADLIILSENPLKIDSLRLRDIKVLETIKNGRTIYKRND